VCVCRAGGRVFVLGPTGLHECLAKEHEPTHIAWDIKCEPEQKEAVFL
jgi:hypothetical protein